MGNIVAAAIHGFVGKFFLYFVIIPAGIIFLGYVIYIRDEQNSWKEQPTNRQMGSKRVKGPTLYGMSKAEFTSGTGYKGDSGGPIYLEHKLYGIYSGDDADKDDRTKTATYFWYSPIYGAAGFTVKTSS